MFKKTLRRTSALPILMFCCSFWGVHLTAGCIYDLPFHGSVNENGNVLSWITQAEDQNNFFIIERSKDGIRFETAVKIEGAGNSDERKSYRFVDITPDHSRTFYRLLQIDFDGTTTLSHLIVLTHKSAPGLFDLTAMSAVTTDRHMSLVMDSQVDHSLEYRIMTKLGEIELEGKSELMTGTNAIAIDLQTLEVGTYQFALKVKNEQEILWIQKTDSAELSDDNFARKDKNNERK